MDFPDLPYLIDIQQALWQWPRSRASLLVGAGMSFNAEPLAGVTSNFPTWSQLVKAMFDEVYPPQPNENAQQREQRFSGLNALTLASEYEATFGRQKLERLIKSQIPDMEHLPGKLHKLLLQLPWVDVFTTNYDTLLERTEIYEKAYQPVIKASELTSATSPRIIKLHGSFPSQTPFIITEEDYRCYPRDFAPFINTVRQSLLENILVLIGFSGEDPNFLQWAGWIRDELGIRHNPIYLVGSLNLSPAKRSLLAKRGVTPIDLSPVFSGINTSSGIHSASLEWFLLSLLNTKPLASEIWPNFEKNKASELTYTPQLIELKTKYPKSIEISSRNHFVADETEILDVMARWKFEREKYPKWLIAPESKRNSIWIYTNRWTFLLLNGTKEWNIIDRLLVAYEVNWRLELSLCPLFTDHIEVIDKLINEFFDLWGHGAPSKPDKFSSYRHYEIIDAWFSLTFALLREAREMYNKKRWSDLIEKIKQKLELYPTYEDRYNYEHILWHIWNIERSDAKDILLQWQPSKHNPLANMWKAGLLAELDEAYNATDILRASLTEIRKSLLTNGQSIELLSLEGWCTYLIAKIEPVNRDFSTFYKVRDEFSERWQELRRWGCDPRAYKNHFDDILSTVPPELPKGEIKKRGFDPWSVSTSFHFNNDSMSAFFPGFGYIRMHELVGMPMRLTGFDLGDTLEKSCVWIMPFIKFWSPALLIRSGNKKFLEKGNLLSRIEVLKLYPELAVRLYDWCLSALERELTSIKGELHHKSSKNEFLSVLAEILSRLTLKVDQKRLQKAFFIYIKFYSNFYIRRESFILDEHPRWMKRLYDVATTETIISWLPDVINANLADGLHSFYDDRFPELTSYLPMNRLKAHNHSDNNIKTSINNLITRAEKETSKNWELAIYRLLNLKNCGLLSKNQIKKLSKLMWKNCIDNELPKLHVWMSTYINLPQFKNKKPDDIIKKILLANPLENIVTINEDGKLSISYPNRRNFLMAEAIYVTKPFVLSMIDHRKDGIDWTPEETKLLLEKLYDWWEYNKIAFDRDHQTSFGNPVKEQLMSVEKFLYIVILPRMDWAEKHDWEKLINWLNEIRNLGVFISSVYPYILLYYPSEEEIINEILSNDLMSSNNEEAIEASARAIRHWTHLTQINDSISKNTNHLISFLIERVIFRHQLGLLTCLNELSHLIVELPNIFNKQQFYLMAASLTAWHYATILNGTSEFHDEDKPDLRSMVASFAGALFTWHQKQQSNEPLPQSIEQWQKMCEMETLPEVKYAFDIRKAL